MRHLSKQSKTRVALSALLASTALGFTTPALAQDAADDANDDEIVVTAQKREQNLQDVPISIQALGQSKLEDAQVASFDDYQKLLPSVSSQLCGPSTAQRFYTDLPSHCDGQGIGLLPASCV